MHSFDINIIFVLLFSPEVVSSLRKTECIGMFKTGLIDARVRYSLKGDTEEYMCVMMMRFLW